MGELTKAEEVTVEGMERNLAAYIPIQSAQTTYKKGKHHLRQLSECDERESGKRHRQSLTFGSSAP